MQPFPQGAACLVFRRYSLTLDPLVMDCVTIGEAAAAGEFGITLLDPSPCVGVLVGVGVVPLALASTKALSSLAVHTANTNKQNISLWQVQAK